MSSYTNHIGVWMDHHSAHLVYQKSKHVYEVETLESLADKHPREDGQSGDGANFGEHRSSNNEYSKHNKEQQDTKHYFASLAKVLAPYDDILLFGPTEAKKEFFNYLFEDKSFSGKSIMVENSDKLTPNQLIALVRDYFAAPKHK
jgi:hypothetical protein